MDVLLEKILPAGPGVFVEAGAHDGFTQSNTYYLERYRGWTGVLVEAIPELYEKAKSRRLRSQVVNCALVGPEEDGQDVEMRFGDLMSKVGDDFGHVQSGLENAGRAGYTIAVPGRTISSVLDEAGVSHVDLLSLDVEGNEVAALEGLDTKRHTVSYILVEMLDMRSQRGEFDRLLTGRYKFFEALSPWDALYRSVS
jgi:FkbM family methyltransferase